MAKKAEAAVEGFSTEKQGAGWKACPQCHGYVKGPLTKLCPSCGHQFAFKSRMVAKPQTGTVDREKEIERKVMLLALKMGGTGKVVAAVEKLKADPLMDFVLSCGGSDNTLRIVRAVEEQTQQFKV